MTADEMKAALTEITEVPQELLRGETDADNIDIARRWLAYRKAQEPEPEPSGEAELAQLLGMDYDPTGSEAKYRAASAALDTLETAAADYPAVRDGGSAGAIADKDLPDRRSKGEKFRDWFNNVTAWNPKKRGW